MIARQRKQKKTIKHGVSGLPNSYSSTIFIQNRRLQNSTHHLERWRRVSSLSFKWLTVVFKRNSLFDELQASDKRIKLPRVIASY